MQTTKIVFWEDKGAWLGYLQDYPDSGHKANRWMI